MARVPLSGDVANDFNPLYELANRKIDQDRNRFTGAGKLRWRMQDWLQAEGSFGYDQEAQSYKDTRPFGFLTSSGQKTKGSLYQETRNNWQANAGLTLLGLSLAHQSLNLMTREPVGHLLPRVRGVAGH